MPNYKEDFRIGGLFSFPKITFWQNAHGKIGRVNVAWAMKLKKKIATLPKGLTFAILVILVDLLLYGILFLIEKPVTFTYAAATCTNYPLLLPDAYMAQSSDEFQVRPENKFKIGNVVVFSSSVCFVPAKAPENSDKKISISLFGGLLARKTFTIRTATTPVVNTEVLSRPVPVTRSLAIPLSDKDVIFSYALKVNDKTAPCKPQGKDLICDIKSLDLAQGVSYNLSLDRIFRGERASSLFSQTIQTLPATRLVESSIKQGEQVFAKPKTISLAFDKKLVKQEVKLYRKTGDAKEEVTAEIKASDNGITINLVEELPRQAEFELTVASVEAEDGSGLEDPIVVPFTTSGGPKVASINVGRTGVAVGTTVTVTFDQPLSETQDVSRVIKLGGGAAYAGKKANQLYVSLKDTPKCGDFSIEITNSLQSSHEIAGGSAWSFSGRTLCYTVGTIGYSVGGRPINAYYFGNGPRTVVYTGAIHGNELGTKYLMDRWIQDLEANARSIPADKSVIVVPQINPDGVASGSRVNRRNVDLNRNFAVSDWQKDITDVNNRPFPGGGGEAPMSEPETKALAALISSRRPIFVMSYHSIGGVLAANQAGDSASRASTYSQLSGYRNVTGQTAETFDYSITGTADDWYAEALGIPSVLVELSSHTSAQFDRNQKAMWSMLTR